MAVTVTEPEMKGEEGGGGRVDGGGGRLQF